MDLFDLKIVGWQYGTNMTDALVIEAFKKADVNRNLDKNGIFHSDRGSQYTSNDFEYQDDKYGCGVVGKIINVSVDEKVLKDDRVDISLVNAICFDPYTHGYYAVGKRVGEAFKDGFDLE